MSRFYSLPLKEVEALKTIELKEYVWAMERLEAQELLTKLKIMDYPNMKDDARNKFHKSIHKKAFPVQKVHSFDDIDSLFRGGL